MNNRQENHQPSAHRAPLSSDLEKLQEMERQDPSLTPLLAKIVSDYLRSLPS